jgi:WhiB family redox-sensing transcriptional regulator
MHADIVGIAPRSVTRHGQEERKIGGRLLTQAPRAGSMTATPAYAPRAGRAGPAYARAAGPQPLRRAADPAKPPCRSDPELFFAESPEDIRLAKALCSLCPVRRACLAGALQRAEPCGVWGGELLLRGAVIAEKRPRGRPRKSAPPIGGANGASAWRSAS